MDDETQPEAGVFVHVKILDDGSRKITYELVGGFDPLAAPAALELAALVARHRLGLPDVK
jgi:hypothetical protein